MPDKKKFALRIDPKMYKALEQWAADEFRSLNGQIEYLLNQALKKNGRSKRSVKKEDKPELPEKEEKNSNDKSS